MNNCLNLNVIKVSQNIGSFYIASIKAKNLLEISYVDRMRLKDETSNKSSYLGIQRELKPLRVKQIAQYVQEIDASFPTSIILSVTEDCTEITENNDGSIVLTLKPLSKEEIEERINLGFISSTKDESIKNYYYNGIAKILDGQHRLAGLEYAINSIKTSQRTLFDTDDSTQNEEILEKLENFELNVVIFVGYDLYSQAQLFGTINLAQTKVNKSLVYNLEEYTEARTPQSVCHNIAKLLDNSINSPLYHRIKMLGCKTVGRKNFEPITQATFVESLIKMISKEPLKERDILKRKALIGKVKYLEHTDAEKEIFVFRNLFENKKDGEMLDVIWNYFEAIKRRWPNAWEDIDNYLLPKNNCFRALMRYLRDVYPSLNKEKPAIEDFFKVFEKFEIQDSDFSSTRKIFERGEAGMSKFYKYLSGKISYAELKQEN